MDDREVVLMKSDHEHIAEAARLAAPIFQAMGWTWGGYRDEERIPTSEEIAISLAGLVRTARENPGGTSSSGRFYVTCDEDDGSVEISVQVGEIPARETSA